VVYFTLQPPLTVRKELQYFMTESLVLYIAMYSVTISIGNDLRARGGLGIYPSLDLKIEIEGTKEIYQILITEIKNS
jgi:hypothetical protein